MYIGLSDKNQCKSALQILVRYRPMHFLRIQNLIREWCKGYLILYVLSEMAFC